MGVLTSLSTGITGLQSHGEALGVTADNIANANTMGFKASRAEFEDIIGKNIKGILGGNQIGRGAKLSAVNQILTQGNLDQTEKATDLAISGDGYFVVKGSDGVTYTRAGSFKFDKEGYLITNDNQRVQGFQGNENGKIVNEMGDIHFPKALVPAKATTELNLALNLDSRAEISPPFNPKDPYGTSQFATGVEIFDSQGNKHLMTMFFTKTADRTWDYHGMCPAKEVTGGGEEGYAQVVQGRIGFTVDGKLNTQDPPQQAFNFMGGALQGQQIKISFGDAIVTDKGKGLSGTKQYGKESDLISWNQNGSAAGTITSLAFNDEGTLTALYSNGRTEDLAQIALAKFESPESTLKLGSNRVRESHDSGTASIGKPNSAGRGKIYAKTLERSTVDLAAEFVNLIQGQRNFQANAKTITTTDELLQEVINLKR